MPQIRLLGGMVIRFTARDPAANADVAGVTVSDIHVYGQDLGGGGDDLPAETPHWLPIGTAGD